MFGLITFGIMFPFLIMVILASVTSIYYIWHFDLFSLNLLAILLFTFILSFGSLWLFRKKLVKKTSSPIVAMVHGVLLNPFLGSIFFGILTLFLLEKNTLSTGIASGLTLTTISWFIYIFRYK